MLRSYSMGHALCGQMLAAIPETTSSNIHVCISLDSLKRCLTFWDRCKRRLKLSVPNDDLQDFLGLGARRFGLFIKRKLKWYINHSDIVSIDVISIAVGSKKPQGRTNELQRRKTRKGIKVTCCKSRQSRSFFSMASTQRQGTTMGTGRVGGGKPPAKLQRVVKASKRVKKRARLQADKQRQKMTPVMDYYIKFLVNDRIAAAAQQLLLRYHAEYKASKTNERQNDHQIDMAQSASVERSLKVPLRCPYVQHKSVEPNATDEETLGGDSAMTTTIITLTNPQIPSNEWPNNNKKDEEDDEDAEDDEEDEDEEDVLEEGIINEGEQEDEASLTAQERKHTARLLHELSKVTISPEKAKKKVVEWVSRRDVIPSRQVLLRGGRTSMLATRLVKCPDKYTALEIFALLSNHLQGELHSNKRIFQQAVASTVSMANVKSYPTQRTQKMLQ